MSVYGNCSIENTKRNIIAKKYSKHISDCFHLLHKGTTEDCVIVETSEVSSMVTFIVSKESDLGSSKRSVDMLTSLNPHSSFDPRFETIKKFLYSIAYFPIEHFGFVHNSGANIGCIFSLRQLYG